MTTTAEKIKDPANIQCPVCGYYCLGNGGAGCIDKPSLQNKPKPPPDPEPLECWVLLNCGEIVRTVDRPIAGGRHMRQVTPQDEQDRLDAARYRSLKENKHLCFRHTRTWDELIDKAMEGE